MKAPTRLDDAFLATRPLPSPPEGEGKEGRGRVLIIAGGAEVPGAALLAGVGALRAGAGKLQMAATDAFAVPLALAMPESRVIRVTSTKAGEIAASAADELAEAVRRSDAVVVGPGMVDEALAARLTKRLAALDGKAMFVVDAAALSGLGGGDGLAGLRGRAVLTPHAGEMATLLEITKDDVIDDPIAAARQAAARFQAVVALKGATTWIVSPSGEAWRHDDGVIGLGTSGSGDVLAGVIGGLLARGAPPLDATLWGVRLHARAGERLTVTVGQLGFLAREIADAIRLE